MHKILWQFIPRPEEEEAFRKAYGPGGPWARLFGRSSGYLGTELLFDPEEGRYLTIDSWSSRGDFEGFNASFGKEYDELDRQLEGLTLREELLGNFDSEPHRNQGRHTLSCEQEG